MRIICIHQGYELYGSDRTFLDCVDFLREMRPDARITVVLPRDGVLADRMRADGYAVRILDLWVLRKSYGAIGLLRRGAMLPLFVRRARALLRDADLVYVNTGVIFDFAIAARARRGRGVIHVHEIPGRRVRPLFGALVRLARCAVIFNSRATQASLPLPAAIPSRVVHNGTDIPDTATPPAPHDGLRVLMIGRINAWKGQDLLVEALAALPKDTRDRIAVRVLGDVFEGAPFLERLRRQVADAGLAAQVEFKGFHPDPDQDYRWADVVAVPSREPEPFGLVAIEAMARARPVIAAGHGGLAEIVVDGETGWRFAPGDPAALANALSRALDDRETRLRYGAAARVRARDHFSRDAFRASFQAAIRDLCPKAGLG